MSKIHHKIKSFLNANNLDNSNLTYLVAFSGGYDSMCLLDSLRKVCDNKIVAIHLNHNWRGDESDKEEQYCAEFCKKIGIEFYSEKLGEDIAHTETAAREARYTFFEKCAKNFDSKIIFTAHNRNDQVETLIFRICHGTGITGLKGIAKHRGIYYRPILDVSRSDIEAYCSENELNPNCDSSNNDTIHKRNLIRSKILPLMSQVYPNVNDSLNSLSIMAEEDTQIVKEYIHQILTKISKNNGKISTKDFLKLSEIVQKRIIYELITPMVPQDYDRERIIILWNFIKKNASSKAGKTVSVTTNRWLFVSEKFIEIINNNKSKAFSIKITKTGEYEYGGNIINICTCGGLSDEHSCVSGNSVYVDFSSLVDFDFELRNRREGDIIQPKGMTGHQKLKKYLNSRKIPNHEKDNLLLLAKGKEVLWIAGVGISETICVKSNPTHIIKIKKSHLE